MFQYWSKTHQQLASSVVHVTAGLVWFSHFSLYDFNLKSPSLKLISLFCFVFLRKGEKYTCFAVNGFRGLYPIHIQYIAPFFEMHYYYLNSLIIDITVFSVCRYEKNNDNGCLFFCCRSRESKKYRFFI